MNVVSTAVETNDAKCIIDEGTDLYGHREKHTQNPVNTSTCPMECDMDTFHTMK